MISENNIDELLVLATLPVVVVVFWAFHVIYRFKRNLKAKVTFRIMAAGLPVVGVLLFLWSTSMPSPNSGIASMSGPGFLAMVCSFIAGILWILVVILEMAIQLVLGALDLRKPTLNDS